MLYSATVAPDTMERLKQLMLDEKLKNFFLVGGTALSLQIGHRISIDIDLFSLSPFDENRLLDHLESDHKFVLDYQDNNTLKGKIADTIVDLITHAYPMVNDIILNERVRMASLEDMAAMKLNAIMGNGSRLKDFIDVAYLSSHLSLSQMLDAFEKKYASRNIMSVVKSLSYHKDISFNEPIKLLNATYQWEPIALRLDHMIQYPEKVFLSISKAMRQKQERSKGKGLQP